jgi:hypothetical protein
VLEVGEVFAPLPVERRQHSGEVHEERVAAPSGEEGIGPGQDDFWLRSEGHLGVAHDRLPNDLSLTSLLSGCHVDSRSLPAVLGLAEHHADCDVGDSVPVVVDVDAVDGVGVKRWRYPECVDVEDQHCPRRVRGRLEGKEVGDVQARIFGWRSEPQPGEVIRHAVLLTNPTVPVWTAARRRGQSMTGPDGIG